MADLNVSYQPYTHEYDLNAIKVEVAYDFLPDNVKANVDTLLAQLTDFNSKQYTLVNAVKVPYTGKTQAERLQWLEDRRQAVYDRLALIRTDVEGNRQQIINAGGSPPTDVLATIGAVLTVIPLTIPIGALASVIAKILNQDNSDQAYKTAKIQQATAVLNGYVNDTDQLAAIQKQIVAELTASATTSNDVTSNAPTVNTYWYFGLGALLLLILFIWYRRTHKRRKR